MSLLYNDRSQICELVELKVSEQYIEAFKSYDLFVFKILKHPSEQCRINPINQLGECWGEGGLLNSQGRRYEETGNNKKMFTLITKTRVGIFSDPVPLVPWIILSARQWKVTLQTSLENYWDILKSIGEVVEIF